jgi:hypothetical protein
MAGQRWMVSQRWMPSQRRRAMTGRHKPPNRLHSKAAELPRGTMTGGGSLFVSMLFDFSHDE